MGVLVSVAVACAQPADGTGSEVDTEVDAEVDTEGAPVVKKKDGDGDGFTPREGDCDDENPEVYPGAPERCDGVVNDCESEGPLRESGTVPRHRRVVPCEPHDPASAG